VAPAGSVAVSPSDSRHGVFRCGSVPGPASHPSTVSAFFDGRNASVGDGVERALGRKPRDFFDWVREIAATGVWQAA
jgi:hypothetical protein